MNRRIAQAAEKPAVLRPALENNHRRSRIGRGIIAEDQKKMLEISCRKPRGASPGGGKIDEKKSPENAAAARS